MKEMDNLRSTFVVTGLAVGGVAALTALGGYVRREIQRRGYPSWESCRCDFKYKQNIYQVWFSRHERRGETVVAEERGIYLVPSQFEAAFLSAVMSDGDIEQLLKAAAAAFEML